MFPSTSLVLSHIFKFCDPILTPRHLLFVCKNWTSLLHDKNHTWKHWLKVTINNTFYRKLITCKIFNINYCNNSNSSSSNNDDNNSANLCARYLSYRELFIEYVINNIYCNKNVDVSSTTIHPYVGKIEMIVMKDIASAYMTFSDRFFVFKYKSTGEIEFINPYSKYYCC